MTYYCRRCAAKMGHRQNIHTSDPLQSQYQLMKFLKHTLPGSHPDSSVFNSTSTGDYADYVVDAAAFGAVEFDTHGRRNVIWIPGRPTGSSYKGSALVGPTDGVKVVLSSEAGKVHAFPVTTTNLTAKVCASCGGSVAM